MLFGSMNGSHRYGEHPVPPWVADPPTRRTSRSHPYAPHHSDRSDRRTRSRLYAEGRARQRAAPSAYRHARRPSRRAVRGRRRRAPSRCTPRGAPAPGARRP
ncbi:hypothetical protein AMK18_33155 [Streptomyces sp. CB01249]|nr:hypothetical protein AMK18_33155 [Streptomyces sp. CB01249]